MKSLCSFSFALLGCVGFSVGQDVAAPKPQDPPPPASSAPAPAPATPTPAPATPAPSTPAPAPPAPAKPAAATPAPSTPAPATPAPAKPAAATPAAVASPAATPKPAAAAAAVPPSTTPTNAPSAAPSGSGYGYKFHVEDRFAGVPEDPKFPIDQPDGQVLPFPLKDPKAGVGPRRDKKSINDFPPEPRDVFRKMDQTMTVVYVDQDHQEHRLKAGEKPLPDWTAQQKLLPLQFDLPPGSFDQNAPDQKAVYGRNTWMLWCGGNEDFWTYLAEESYGILDFLKAIDSRKRSSRLHDLGLVNQPGLVGTVEPGPYGLYIDRVKYRLGEEENAAENQPPLYDRPKREREDPNALEGDGVDPLVYGYPSGVLGLRLFPNPQFDEKAKAWWNPKAFYEDPVYASDPRTIRPFRVGMSCVICHIGPNPMNLPRDPEEPKWENLSSLIGNQYFRTSAAFASRLTPGSFLWHYVASQQPGTIDTSMVSTDSIDNFNSMNGLFEMPARVSRAGLNPAEHLSGLQPTINGDGAPWRHFPRVLMDGEDSIGLEGALLRVYLNIGLYHDEWKRCSNLLIGFGGNRPFPIEVMRSNSVYWRVNENFRIPYMAAFLGWQKRDGNNQRIQCATGAMHLKDAITPDGKPFAQSTDPALKPHQWRPSQAEKGGRVFTKHCMVCHSSKQPEGFEVAFSHDPPLQAKSWADAPVEGNHLTLPFAYFPSVEEEDATKSNWELYKKSPAFVNYQQRAKELVDAAATNDDDLHFFHSENYLSTDLRIPVTLTETNSARAVATNAVEGQVFANFSSDTYKHDLPDVGKITYYDPFEKEIGKAKKQWTAPGGGRGYYRVPTLVALWATAPYLHDNALGLYLGDEALPRRVSLEGRLTMFDDGIRKLLWKDRRHRTPSGEGGLRTPGAADWHGGDPGWIFRTDVESEARFPRGHIRHLITGVLPGILPGWSGGLALWLLDHPLVLPTLALLLALVLYFFWRSAFFFLLGLTGIVLLLVFGLTGLCYLMPWPVWLLLPLILILGALAQLVPRNSKHRQELKNRACRSSVREKLTGAGIAGLRWAGLVALAVLLVGFYGALWFGREFVDGHFGDLRVGPIPKGVPVSALMNLDPAAGRLDQLAAVRGLLQTFGKLRADDHKPADARMTEEERLKLFNETAGPALLRASKCPDWVLDRGHYFGEALTDEDKEALIAFLKTL